jgi:hypothetical protein
MGTVYTVTLAGLVSGWVESHVGYPAYFVLALLATAPSIAFTRMAPFHYSDGSDASA